jgi:hypothetical protein
MNSVGSGSAVLKSFIAAVDLLPSGWLLFERNTRGY